MAGSVSRKSEKIGTPSITADSNKNRRPLDAAKSVSSR